MAIQHTYLPGTAIPYEKNMFFELFQTGNVYMGFARNEPMWGFCSLFKVRHRVDINTWPTDIMGQEADSAPTKLLKYYDINSDDILTTTPDDGKQVYLAIIDSASDKDTPGNYTFIDRDNIGLLLLDYMNEEWARVRGLDNDYFNYLLTQYPLDSYDYYLFNYNREITTRMTIDSVEKVGYSTMRYPVRIQYSTIAGATQPTTAIGTDLSGDLTRTINMLGETEITGLDSDFVSDLNGWIENNNLDNATFFLTTTDGVVIQDEMQYVEKIVIEAESSVVFSYPLVGEAVENSGRIKVTSDPNADKLAVFPERFTDGMLVTDSNPPPIVLNYSRTGMFQMSVMDVLSIVQIESGDIQFAKRIDTIATEKLLLGDAQDSDNYPGVQGIARDELVLISIAGNPDTTVSYAVTDSIDIARRYSFDLVKVTKNLDEDTPTDQVYRQLFLCYAPQIDDGGGGYTPATDATHDHADLFIESNWSYYLGTILYLANKVPVYRKYIDNTEQIQIMV